MTREYFENKNNMKKKLDEAMEVIDDIKETIDSPTPSETQNNNNENREDFGNLSLNMDMVLKAVFWGAIFYLLSLPDVKKMTYNLFSKKVHASLIHSILFAVLYFVISQLI